MKRNTLLFLISLIVVFGCWYSSLAQASQDSVKYALSKGIWSFQFAINDNFTLTDFQGMNISAKYSHLKNHAIRFGISFSGSNETQEDNYVHKFPLIYLEEYIRTTDINSFSIELYSQYLLYPSLHNRFSLFTGCGPFVGYETTNWESDRQIIYNDTLFENTMKTEERKIWQIGLNFVIGIEWFITKSLSLSAEYVTLFYYSENKTIMESSRKPDNFVTEIDDFKSDGIYINSAPVRFGISIYLN